MDESIESSVGRMATLLQAVRDSFAEKLVKNAPADVAEQIVEVIDFRLSLHQETDRGSALMAAAFLDDRLRGLLAKRLVNDKKIADRSFDFNGPLGSFSSRIDFSYLLGLIPNNARRDLHLIRAIRNKFAHTAAIINFDHPLIKPSCDSLLFHGVNDADCEPGQKFRRTVMGLMLIIVEAYINVAQINKKDDTTIPDRTNALDEANALFDKILQRTAAPGD